MAKTNTNSFMLTDEEQAEIESYIKSQTMSTGEHVTKSSLYREAIFRYIRNGKPEAEQDDKQEPAELSPEEPTDLEHNPFADLNFDS